MYHYKPCVHTNSLYIQDNQKPLKVVNTASPYCSFEDCATKLNYEYAWLIYQAEVNIVNIDFTMHDIKETGARSTSGHTFKQAIPPTDLVEAYLSVRLFSFFLFFFFLFFFFFFFFSFLLFFFFLEVQVTIGLFHFILNNGFSLFYELDGQSQHESNNDLLKEDTEDDILT